MPPVIGTRRLFPLADMSRLAIPPRAPSQANKFDSIVGALEELLMDEEFCAMQEAFCLEHCSAFEDTEENKLCYTDIFSRYTEEVEGFIAERLTAMVDDFDMEEFGAMLEARPDEVTGDVFDTLMTFSDFGEFKGLMLAYKGQDRSFALEGSSGALGMEGLSIAAGAGGGFTLSGGGGGAAAAESKASAVEDE